MKNREAIRCWNSKSECQPKDGERVECLHRDGNTSWQTVKGELPQYVTGWRY